MSIATLVQKTVTRQVDKSVTITPDMVSDLLKKAVGAPAETPLNTVTDENTGAVVGYKLSWVETPKTRAPRKKKEAEQGELSV